MNNRWLLALALVPILALGLGIREVMSRRPQRIVTTGRANLKVSVSPDGKWLVAEDAPSLNIPPTWFAPRLINLETGQSRQLKGQLLHFSRWTNHSQLSFQPVDFADLSSSKVTFVDPKSLTVTATFAPARGEYIRSWTESKDDVWMLTRREWLHFDARTGKLLQSRPFKAVSSQPKLRLSEAMISPNGQKAIVKFVNTSESMVVLTQLWDLNLGKLTRRKMGIPPQCFIGNNFYLDDGGVQRHLADDFFFQRLIDADNTCYHLDHQKHMGIFTNEDVKWYEVETNRFIEKTRLPTLKYDSLDFSPDHATGYFSTTNGEIWRQRLK